MKPRSTGKRQREEGDQDLETLGEPLARMNAAELC